MQWSDEGIVLSVKPHGETAAIVDLWTRAHGRHMGLVHGGRSRRLRPVLQPGNHIDAEWKARLADQLGTMSVEMRRAFAAEAMDDAQALMALSSITSLTRLLPERDPHPNLYEITLFVLGFFNDATVWPALLVRWEMALLDELGFGLDLSQCAATGSNDQLIYVSPKSGRAVSASAGEPYRDKLLALPQFLTKQRSGAVTMQDVSIGFALTGHFIEKHLLLPRGETLPQSRARLVALLAA
ncbi:DNA repair protein RecO [Hyphomicrobium sp.]|uniref:DNA repair protein RecO n=1 Tax=Hyphomicrobium sp. TaxID=82 RepID=UPI001D27B14A|nr:DNA repair protein RecO [Hyphomicrobium sp.]MBY0559082.1 DNA repair protein RecO [Hyphomicrobium sp.]